MRLELATFPVKNIHFGEHTSYHGGSLEINKDSLLSEIREDRRVKVADLDIAFPGENTRIVNIRDVVEPRTKISGPGCIFPGILGPVETVGEGRTHRLSGMAVISSVQYRPSILTGNGTQNASILDMWGPAAEITPLGTTSNLALILELSDSVTELEAHAAIQLAECKTARRLADTTRDLHSDNVEVFELLKVDPSLPKVVYILSFRTSWHLPHSAVAYYGMSIRESLPTFIHPNELLDGALTTDARRGSSWYPHNWTWMNQPMVIGLLREHGKRLNFLGIILQRTRFETEHGKQVTAACASQMARSLGAEAAIITRTVPSGANLVDVMLTVQACEKKGIKTVLLTPEFGGSDGTEPPLVFFVPEANAMVSTGSTDRELQLPRPSKVIGVHKDQQIQLELADRPFSPWEELTLEEGYIAGASDWWGNGHYTCTEY
jgi:sarcosine reductase